MAGAVTGLHVFGPDVGPESLLLLDGNYNLLIAGANTLANFANYYVDSGAANSTIVTVNAPQVMAAYTDGLLLQVKIAAANTVGNPTANVNALGAKTIFNPDGTALVAGQLVAGAIVGLQYSTALGGFQLVSGVGGSSTPANFAATVTIKGVAGGASLLSLIDGTETAAFSFDAGHNAFISVLGAHAINLQTNGGTRLSVGSAGAVTINQPTAGVALTITNLLGQDVIDVNLNQQGGVGWVLNATGTVNGDVRGCLFTNTNTGTSAGILGLSIQNSSINAFNFWKTGVNFSGSKRPGTPAGEICLIEAGGAIPMCFTVNNAEALAILGTGAVRVDAPASGNVALTVTGVAGSSALQVLTTGVQVGSPIGADEGAGNINLAGGLFVQGLAPSAQVHNSAPAAFSTVETYVTPAYSWPANSLAVGNLFEIRIHGNCTSSATNLVTINLRVGANGTTADAAVVSNNGNSAASGSGNGFNLRFYVTINTIGASANLVAHQELLNTGTAGISTIAVAQIAGNLSSNFNSTTALKIGVSMVTAAATTTISIFQAEIIRLF